MMSSMHETIAETLPLSPQALYDATYKTAHDAMLPVEQRREAALRLEEFWTNHATYLEGQVMPTRTAAIQQGLDAHTLHKKQSVVFAVDNSHSAVLHPEQLGLPAFHTEHTKTCGLIIRRSDEGDVSVQLLTVDRKGVPLLYYLESMVAGVDGPNHVTSEATWVAPGHIRVAKAGRIEVTKLESKGSSTEIMVSSPTDGSTYDVIRPQPTRYERTLTLAHSPYDQRRARIANSTGQFVTATAGLVFAVASTVGFAAHHFEPGENPGSITVKTADDLVGSSTVDKVGNKPQVEAKYSEATLARTREAVRAYMAGDTRALENLRQQSGYEADWADPEAVKALSEAQNFTELEQRFSAIFRGGSISLTTTVTEAAVSLGEDQLTAQDFVKAKATAEAAVVVLQRFDKRLIDKTRLTIVLSKHITVDSEAAGGVFVPGTGTDRMDIDVNGYDVQAIIGHEFTHSLDYRNSYELSRQASYLNPSSVPSGMIYVGEGYKDETKDNTVNVGGYKVVVRSYGRKDAAEDAATVGEQWFSDKGAVQLDLSPAGQKLLGYLLALEDIYPGTTAEFLLAAQPKVYTEASPLDYAAYGFGEVGTIFTLPVQGALGGAFVTTFLESIVRSMQRRDIKCRGKIKNKPHN